MARIAIGRALLDGPPELVAPALLGSLLVRGDGPGLRAGRIVEVEAYGGAEDRASHARFGLTPRNRAMFGAAGRAYVYGVYGMHLCLNVVTGSPGTAAAVLVRAVEPITGVAAMRAARVERAVATRRADTVDPAAAAARLGRVAEAHLASGPGNLGAAFGITAADDGIDLLAPASELRLEWPAADAIAAVPTGVTVGCGPRIGVSRAGAEWAERPWRFWLAGNPAVSGRR